jgi:hypothetical protein
MRTIALSMIALLAIAGQGGEDKAGLGKGLEKAIRTFAALKSYAFQIDERPGQGSAGSFQGKYEQGKPIFFIADKIEFFKKGDVLAYKDGDKWERSRTGTLSDPLRILGAAAKVRGARLPHDELLELAKNIKKAKQAKDEQTKSTIFTGELEQAGAKKLVPKSFDAVAKKGQAKIWVGLDGQVQKYSLTIRVQGRQGNAEIDGEVSRTVSLSERGTAKIDVPDAAKKALDK